MVHIVISKCSTVTCGKCQNLILPRKAIEIWWSLRPHYVMLNIKVVLKRLSWNVHYCNKLIQLRLNDDALTSRRNAWVNNKTSILNLDLCSERSHIRTCKFTFPVQFHLQILCWGREFILINCTTHPWPGWSTYHTNYQHHRQVEEGNIIIVQLNNVEELAEGKLINPKFKSAITC